MPRLRAGLKKVLAPFSFPNASNPPCEQLIPIYTALCSTQLGEAQLLQQRQHEGSAQHAPKKFHPYRNFCHSNEPHTLPGAAIQGFIPPALPKHPEVLRHHAEDKSCSRWAGGSAPAEQSQDDAGFLQCCMVGANACCWGTWTGLNVPALADTNKPHNVIYHL